MSSPRIYSIHDQAITIELGQEIDELINLEVIRLKKAIESHPFDGFIECVPAYSSLTIYFDEKTTSDIIINEIKKRHQELILNRPISDSKKNRSDEDQKENIITIPVCYDLEFGTDLECLSEYLKLSTSEIIELHTNEIFRVYMMGFIPGFAYMGTLPEKLHAPRKQTPAQHIPVGSVAIAGKQTGIYPAAVPGGWQIIGRTPLVMFDKYRDPTSLLKTGDLVQFKSISKKDFESIS